MSPTGLGEWSFVSVAPVRPFPQSSFSFSFAWIGVCFYLWSWRPAPVPDGYIITVFLVSRCRSRAVAELFKLGAGTPGNFRSPSSPLILPFFIFFLAAAGDPCYSGSNKGAENDR